MPPVGGATGPSGQPVDTGQGTQGSEGAEGAKPPAGTGEGSEGTRGPGGSTEGGELNFGSDFGLGTELPGDAPPTDMEEGDLASRQLCNTIALRCTEDASARGQIITSHGDSVREDASARADSQLQQDSDTYRADARSEGRRGDMGEILSSGDRRMVDNALKNLLGGTREGATPNKTQGQPQPMPGQQFVQTRAGTQQPTQTGQTQQPQQPPIFPNATGRLANLTQPRMDQLSGRIQQMPNGEQKTQAQQLETRLRQAIASGNQQEASQIMDQLAAMGIEMGGEQEAGGVEEEGEVGEGDVGEGEGEGSGVGRRESGEGATPRLARTHLSQDHLQQGVMVFHGGGGTHGEQGDHLTRMGTGLRTVLSGRGTEAATRLSTDDAVRGVLYQGGDGDGDTAGGGGNGDSSVAFGNMVDTDGALAARGLRLDTAAAGIGGAYGVRTEDGRFIPQWMAMSEHGGLPPGVRAAIARDAGLRTRFGAEAVSGASAGRTGDLWAGMRC